MTLIDAETPTGLKPVLDVIPDRCRERSTARGLLLLGRDLAFYAVAVTGLIVTDGLLWSIPFWILAGLAISGLFVLGHDAAHQALFDSKRWNDVVGRLAMLPSFHATEVWIFGHNRVHHGHTLREGMDFVWHPTSPTEFAALPRWRRWQHRFEWGPFGAGAYYARAVWWNKMVRFPSPPRWRRAMRRDKAIVAAFFLGVTAAAIVTRGAAGLLLVGEIVVIPFLLFCQVIGWVVHVHHISPDIRWWPRREWNRFRGQVEGTTVLWGPPGWELFFHWIMVHLPHHVDMSIPCYRLPEAARAIAEAYPDQVIEKPISVREYLRNVRECKLHDIETGVWSRYPA